MVPVAVATLAMSAAGEYVVRWTADGYDELVSRCGVSVSREAVGVTLGGVGYQLEEPGDGLTVRLGQLAREPFELSNKRSPRCGGGLLHAWREPHDRAPAVVRVWVA
ncbi:MAG: hypothetical protein QOF69_76 [Solirubrobacteraceae bacterium]|jgi:hypothetical protein|nr:hypothetical protein [Solirubrobacteraceae bacterium]